MNDNQVFKKALKSRIKTSNSIKKGFNSRQEYNEKYLKTKMAQKKKNNKQIHQW